MFNQESARICKMLLLEEPLKIIASVVTQFSYNKYKGSNKNSNKDLCGYARISLALLDTQIRGVNKDIHEYSGRIV